MPYSFSFNTDYQYTLDSVNQIPAVERVFPSYSFDFLVDYRFEGGNVVEPNPYPYRTVHRCTTYENATPTALYVKSLFGESLLAIKHNCLLFNDGERFINKLTLTHDQNDSTFKHVCSVNEDAKNLKVKYGLNFEQSELLNYHKCVQFENAAHIYDKLEFSYRDGIFNVIDYCIKYENTRIEHEFFKDGYYFQPNQDVGSPYTLTFEPITGAVFANNANNTYTFNNSSDYLFTLPVIITQGNVNNVEYEYKFNGFGQFLSAYKEKFKGSITNHTCYNVKQATLDLVHFCEVYQNAKRPDKGKSVIIIPPIEPPVPIIPKQVTIPAKNYYDNLVTFTVKRGTEVISDLVNFESFSANVSVNVNPWQFELITSNVEALTLINKGDVLEVDLGHAGYVFKMYVESKFTKLRFNSSNVVISGRGLTAEMSTPFVAPNNVTYGSDLNLTQILELQLPLGWTIVNNNFDWLVPAFTYNVESLSPAATIQDICEKTGAVMVAHPSVKAIDIRPRYPFRPWAVVDADVDYFVPLAAIEELTLTDDIVLLGDSIYIHGTTSDGILANVVKTGEAGTSPLPTIANELIVDANAARALGNRILSASRDVTTIKGLTFIGIDSIPLILPTYVCKVDGQYLTVSSLSLQVSSSQGIPTIRQALTFGESTTDALTAINELIPSSPVLIGEVMNVDGDALIIQTPEGGSFRAFGNGVVGGKYYFKSGQIIGNAPTLADVPITI